MEFQGSRIANIPESPGLYACYYRPTSVRREFAVPTLVRFLSADAKVTTNIEQRYGVHIVGDTLGEIFLGSEKQAVKEAVAEAFDQAEPFLEWFFRSDQFVHFCRPVYIGIAKNLYDRVYNQHYLSLTQLWADSSSVSQTAPLLAASWPQTTM